MHVLITGSTGFLGSNLMSEFSKAEHTPYAMLRQKDGPHVIHDPAFEKCIKFSQPEAIVHCAALANVEECQKSPPEAFKANTEGTDKIVRLTPPECKFVYISTDMVYSGLGPHKEDDAEPGYPPLNTYGLSKFHAEERVQIHPNHLILRVNFFGYQKGLARWIIDSLEERKKIELYYDMQFSPLHVKTLSVMIRKLAESSATGTYNLGSTDGFSKLGFGMEIAKVLDLQDSSIETIRYNGIPRPYDTRMHVDKAADFFGGMPTLRDEIKRLKGEYDGAVASRSLTAI